MKSSVQFERKEKSISINRKARHEFEITQSVEAGIVLQGTEVKSLRSGKCSMQDAYAAFGKKDSLELTLINLHISPYDHGNRENHDPKRPRTLLMTARELKKLKTAVSEKGITLIPLSVYFSGPFVKVEIGLAKAKRKYDKRESNKERDTEREIRRKYKM
jgi:SsrA-binding protein